MQTFEMIYCKLSEYYGFAVLDGWLWYLIQIRCVCMCHRYGSGLTTFPFIWYLSMLWLSFFSVFCLLFLFCLYSFFFSFSRSPESRLLVCVFVVRLHNHMPIVFTIDLWSVKKWKFFFSFLPTFFLNVLFRCFAPFKTRKKNQKNLSFEIIWQRCHRLKSTTRRIKRWVQKHWHRTI